jgi:hypothetical protein
MSGAADVVVSAAASAADGSGARSRSRSSVGWRLISQTVALRVVRACFTAWAMSAYIKASVLAARGRPTGLLRLYLSPMPRSLRQILTAYHISMFYVTIRSLGGGTPGWLHLCLSRALSRHMPSVFSIAVTVLLGVVALDEVVYALAVASLDDTRDLLSTPCSSTARDSDADMQCCICHEGEGGEGGPLLHYCTSGAHPAHTCCMEQWYTCGRWASSTCPVCRQPLTTRRRPLADRLHSCAQQPKFVAYAARRTAVTAAVAAAVAMALRVVAPQLLRPGHPHLQGATSPL